jgi:hypothetical protein
MSEILLNEAKRLLTQADLSVDNIAMMLGYKTNAHFSRQFKRWTAMTPSEYRSLVEREEQLAKGEDAVPEAGEQLESRAVPNSRGRHAGEVEAEDAPRRQVNERSRSLSSSKPGSTR